MSNDRIIEGKANDDPLARGLTLARVRMATAGTKRITTALMAGPLSLFAISLLSAAVVPFEPVLISREAALE